jgi:hypothetical protein
MNKTFLQLLYEFFPGDKAYKLAQKKKDTKTGKRSTERESLIVNTFKTSEYKTLVKKFKDDPKFKDFFTNIRKNNVMFLNRMYRLLKTRDPELDSLKKNFDKTINDSEYFSYLNSFIVPFKSLKQTSSKIIAGKLWDDQNYKKFLSDNVFELVMPKSGLTANPDNVMITWNYTEKSGETSGTSRSASLSIKDFNERMKNIVSNYQKFDNILDAIIKTKIIKNLLIHDVEKGETVIRVGSDINKIKTTIERKKFLQNIATFISYLKYPDANKNIVIGLKKIKENPDLFNDNAFDYLLNSKKDDITFMFNEPDIYADIESIYDVIKEVKNIYDGYTKETKTIIDSTFLRTSIPDQKVRAPFGSNISEMLDIIKKIKEFGIKFHALKELLKDIKDGKEIPLDAKNKTILSINGKDLSFLMDRLANSIVRLESIRRICEFIKAYNTAQFHNMLNLDEIKDDDDELEDYYVMASIVPEDLMAQSTYQFWTSCQNLINGRTNFNQYVGSGALVGNIVIFLLALDWSKPTGGAMKSIEGKPVHSSIKDPKELMSIDEFKEKANAGILGTKKLEIRQFLRSYAIRPIGRVLIKTFELTPNGIRDINNEPRLEGGLEEELETLKFVDRLYTPHEDVRMISKKGTPYGQSFNLIAASFYKSMQSIVKRLNLPSKTGDYGQRQYTYVDSPPKINYGKLQKALDLGEKINFSRQTTKDLLEAFNKDKNLIKYKSFRHALFFKDDIDGTLDLSGTNVQDLDPMHPTNLPLSDVDLPDDMHEDIESMNGAWMVNDNFIKDSGDFDAPLTKSELARYGK